LIFGGDFSEKNRDGHEGRFFAILLVFLRGVLGKVVFFCGEFVVFSW
jgi:hypothetical protein